MGATDSRHSHAIAPNLLYRNFEAATPDAVWLADISYITTDEGWLYLAAVKDLATMEIVGWSMSERLKSVLCEEALKMAIRSRRLPMGLIHHSARRLRTVIATSYARVLRRPIELAQYACGDYRKHSARPVHAPDCLCIRRDESTARAKRVPWRRNDRMSVTGREVFY